MLNDTMGFGLLRWAALGLVCTAGSMALTKPGLAQNVITPDATLGTEASQVVPLAPLPTIDLIQGGAVRGQNLFHSFEQFNIGAGGQVYFANPTDVTSIFTRITGGQPSEIWGTLGVAGPADLYLLNPNGVLFGETARLDIPGSLLVSTAENLPFVDGFRYTTHPTSGDEVLTVSVPLGLQPGLPTQGTIRNQAQLIGSPGQTITFLGQRIEQAGSLTVASGTLQLLGETVTLEPGAVADVSGSSGGGSLFVGGAFQGSEALPRASQTRVEPGSTLLADAVGQGGGGTIIVWGNDLAQFLGQASARGGADGGNGGLVEVSSLGQLYYGGQVDTRAPQGMVGLLLLDPTTIEIVTDGADTTDLSLVDDLSDPDLDAVNRRTRIAASTLESALSNVVLQASEDIIFNADVFMFTPGVGLTAQAGRDITVNRFIQAAGGGDLNFLAGRNITFNGTGAYAWSYGGEVGLNAGGTISLFDGAQVDTAPFDGDSGNLTVNAQSLTMTNGAQLKTGSFFSGAGGNLTVDVADAIELSGIGFDPLGIFGPTGFIASSLLFGSTGAGGNIRVAAPVIRLLDGGAIAAQSLNDQPGGNITINAPTSIQISGAASSPTGEFLSSISASSSSNAAAGQVFVQTPQLVIEGGGFIGSSGIGLSGPGGVVDITASQIFLDGESPNGEPSGLLARAFSLADAGNIFVRDAQTIMLTNGAQIDVSALGFGASGQLVIDTRDLMLKNGSNIVANSIFGNAGQVNINATGDIILETQSFLTGNIFADGRGAEVSLRANRLQVVGQSFISASTFGAGTGGNLDIQATESIEILNNGFVSTGTLTGGGNGGNLAVRAPLLIIDRGLVDSNSSAGGTAGNITIEAVNLIIRNDGAVSVRGFSEASGTGDIFITADTILLEDEGSILASSPSTNGGSIDLTANQRLVMRRNSLISANAGDPLVLIAPPPGTGDGGNIRISTPFVIAVREENSDIVATATLGNGGQVTLATRGLFGLEFRDERTPLSDITATSEFGLSGTVEISALDTTALENSLTELPDLALNTAALVAGSCIARDGDSRGRFIVTGAGGLPTQPSASGVSAFPTGQVRGVDESVAADSSRPVWQPGDPIVEPTGVFSLPDGRLVLLPECEAR